MPLAVTIMSDITSNRSLLEKKWPSRPNAVHPFVPKRRDVMRLADFLHAPVIAPRGRPARPPAPLMGSAKKQATFSAPTSVSGSWAAS